MAGCLESDIRLCLALFALCFYVIEKWGMQSAAFDKKGEKQMEQKHELLCVCVSVCSGGFVSGCVLPIRVAWLFRGGVKLC